MAKITVEIDKESYCELCEKAKKYDQMIADRRKGAIVINNISAEERKKRAQKAAEARWHSQKK